MPTIPFIPEEQFDPLTAPNHDQGAFADILAGAAAQLKDLFGPREHPDVQTAIRIVHYALSVQRRQMARKLRDQAYGVKRGNVTTPVERPSTDSYCAGLLRAARIVEGGQR